MDPHSPSLLEKPHPLRRADLFGRLAQTQLVAYGLAAASHQPGVEIGRRVPKIFSGSLLTDQLRCLSGGLWTRITTPPHWISMAPARFNQLQVSTFKGRQHQ